MKQDANQYSKTEYRELCKTVKKQMRVEIRKYNVQLVQKALTENRGLQLVKLKAKEGNSLKHCYHGSNSKNRW